MKLKCACCGKEFNTETECDKYIYCKNCIDPHITDKFIIHDKEDFDPYYFYMIQKKYEQVPAKYQTAKKIFEKYSNRVVINLLKQGETPYFSNKNREIYVDCDTYSSGTDFFHEFAHLVVCLKGLTGQTGKEEPIRRFEEFHTSLQKEVSVFVGLFELKAKEMAVKCRIPEARLDTYLFNKTIELMKKEINPEIGTGFKLFGGISDIIDGVTTDKYQITIGHNPTDGVSYWKFKSHMPNEAFANIYEAQMVGNEEELTKIEEIMPESYQIFNKLLQDILLDRIF